MGRGEESGRSNKREERKNMSEGKSWRMRGKEKNEEEEGMRILKLVDEEEIRLSKEGRFQGGGGGGGGDERTSLTTKIITKN